MDIGRVVSVEYNHKPVEIAKQGQEVCIKIQAYPGEAPKMFGRHFEADDVLVSKVRNTVWEVGGEREGEEGGWGGRCDGVALVECNKQVIQISLQKKSACNCKLYMCMQVTFFF